MSWVKESDLEEAALAWFRELGYEVQNAREVGPSELGAERKGYEDVVLTGRLRQALLHLNPEASDEAIDEAVRRVHRRDAPSLVLANEAFHRLLCDGVEVERAQGGEVRGERLRLFDFERPADNDFLVLRQLEVVDRATGTGRCRIPDLVVFVNGLPLAVIELKSPGAEKADVWTGYDQLQTYKHDIPSLFAYNEILVSSDDVEARMGSLTAPRSRFLRWRTVDGDVVASEAAQPLEVLIRGVFEPGRLLELVRHFVVFEAEKTGLVKKLAGYHQFHAVRTALGETRRAIGPKGDRRIGVVWHTQGSGKSLTMLFFAGQLVVDRVLENPTVVVLTDRNDLDDQLFGVFSRGEALLRQKPVQARDRKHLRELLETTSGGVYFTTIQKFLPEKGERFPTLSERRNIVVIADEAHRSQYGLEATVRQATGELVYGYAKHMRDALPNASFIGFTGTPIEKEDADTRKVFGDHISVYDIQRAVQDEATVPILYESRLAKLDLDEALRPQIDPELEEVTEGLELEAREALKTKWATLEKIVGHPDRLAAVAADIVEHFEHRREAMEGKALVVCMSRRICVELYEAIRKLRPHWHDDDDAGGAMKVVISGAASESALAGHVRTKGGRERMAERFKDAADPLRLVIVRDMWLTGFDVPCLHTMYVDKPMRGHNLMQAIARVNRVFGDKPGGLVVDYIGIAAFLKEAMRTYTEGGGQGEATRDQEKEVEVMLEKLEQCRDLMHGFDYGHFETASPVERLRLLPAARDHVLGLQGRDAEGDRDAYERFMLAVTELSRAFALAMPHEAAEAIRVEVAFFQAVRAGLKKLSEGPSRRRAPDYDLAIRQIVSNALVAGEVIDVFEAAGIERPDLSILSEEFLAEVRGLKHKNLAVALLERLLRGEIRERKKYSVVQERSFAELLDQSLARYKNRAIESAEMIEHLLELAREIREAQERGKKLGLSREEFYFYEALADNASARDVMGDPSLAKIAVELTQVVQKNATIDWTQKRNVQAKLRALVKRILKREGYPPDQQQRATELVLEQARRLAVNHVEGASDAEAAPGAWAISEPPPASEERPARHHEPPAPIAYFDALVESQPSVTLRFKTRLEGFEKAMAFLVAAQLGLLRKRRGDLSGADVRKLLGKDLGKPLSMGTWVDYAYALAKLIPKDDPHPIAEASRALLNPQGKRSDLLAKLQDEVVPLRNSFAHKTTIAEESLAPKEQPLATTWAALKKALAPLSSLRLVTRVEIKGLEPGGTLFRLKLRLLHGARTFFPVVEDLADTPLEDTWCYLLDDTAAAISLLPILACRFDDRSGRPELFMARTLGLDPGQKYELLSLTTETKWTGKV